MNGTASWKVLDDGKLLDIGRAPENGGPIEVWNWPADALCLARAAPTMARLLVDMHANHGDRATFDWAYWFSEIEDVLDYAGVHYEEPAP